MIDVCRVYHAKCLEPQQCWSTCMRFDHQRCRCGMRGPCHGDGPLCLIGHLQAIAELCSATTELEYYQPRYPHSELIKKLMTWPNPLLPPAPGPPFGICELCGNPLYDLICDKCGNIYD